MPRFCRSAARRPRVLQPEARWLRDRLQTLQIQCVRQMQVTDHRFGAVCGFPTVHGLGANHVTANLPQSRSAPPSERATRQFDDLMDASQLRMMAK